MEPTMHQVEVEVFSYGGDIPVDRILKAAENANLTRRRVHSMAEIQGKVGIVHPEDDTKWQQVVSRAKHGHVRVRMSTHGLPPSEDPICREGVFVFQLIHPPVRVSKDEWGLLLKGLSNGMTLSELAMGKNPMGLRCFFFKSSMKSLTALAILCQGYLTTHFPRPSDAPVTEKRALDMMGWTKSAETEAGKAIARTMALRKERTASPNWWQNVLGTTNDLVMKQFREEWGSKAWSDEISQLASAIFGETLLENTNVVALAYIELAERLKGGIS